MTSAVGVRTANNRNFEIVVGYLSVGRWNYSAVSKAASSHQFTIGNFAKSLRGAAGRRFQSMEAWRNHLSPELAHLIEERVDLLTDLAYSHPYFVGPRGNVLVIGPRVFGPQEFARDVHRQALNRLTTNSAEVRMAVTARSGRADVALAEAFVNLAALHVMREQGSRSSGRGRVDARPGFEVLGEKMELSVESAPILLARNRADRSLTAADALVMESPELFDGGTFGHWMHGLGVEPATADTTPIRFVIPAQVAPELTAGRYPSLA